MPFDNGWDALVKPGEATAFFTPPQIPAFEPRRTDYSPANAWWLAELSRLVYSRDDDLRRAALAEVDLRQRHFFDVAETEGAVIESGDGSFAVLAFRGTGELEDWLVNLELTAEDWPPGGRVHEGFREALDDVWAEIDRVLDPDQPVFYTGHSLGGALALLAASRRPPRAVYVYGAPRVGNRDFVATLQGVPVFRVVNHRDIVTRLPPSLPHLKLAEAGELHYITHDNRMWVDPRKKKVKKDRRKTAAALAGTVDRRRWFDPPQKLADHSPINYVTHLERYLG